ncbi:peptide deformylase [Rhodospirillaceae bacterium KN72]|uniref:Peptide deformylase-like n=1 Tax=Pacificispira spongiicola TaxID=2729598 RepID=A0A7Y0HID5_9PROT|nr:peptide deformylase [Pacificispira spongiicola]NMM46434.1 peptide deformylase [Pacificispira spongiicola]
MTVRPILRYPDPGLRQPAQPVETFDASITDLIADLTDTLRSVSGIGITAPHIGVSLRVYILNMPGENRIRPYINPRITWMSETLNRHEEGSVSMPGVTDTLERSAEIRLSYQDATGQEWEETAEDFLAVCHQHEIDQLDGVFWIQRLSKLKRDRLVKRFSKLAPTR